MIVIPLFIDDSEDADEALSRPAFEPIWRVLCALRAHDETLADQLDKVRLQLGGLGRHKTKLRLPDKIHIDLPRELPAYFMEAFHVRAVETTTQRQYLPFEEARRFVHGLNLSGQAEWVSYSKGELEGYSARPLSIPSNPQQFYAQTGWVSFGDWFGTNRVAYQKITWLEFPSARTYVHKLGLKSNKEWRRYCANNGLKLQQAQIPGSPAIVYADKGWKDWHDWLGVIRWHSFEEGRTFVRSLKLESKKQWKQYCKGTMDGLRSRPKDVPKQPDLVYEKAGWIDYRDWLGITHHWEEFAVAREFVRGLKLRNLKEWQAYASGRRPDLPLRPDNIPHSPKRIYAGSGWAGFGDWLGTGVIGTTQHVYRPFEDARAFVHKLELKSRAEWIQYCKGEMPDKPLKPDDIPSKVTSQYSDQGWTNWGDFLGTGNVSPWEVPWLPFEEARAFVRDSELKSGAEWIEYCKGKKPNKHSKPDNIPAAPGNAYKNQGWAGMGDWLGTGRIANFDTFYWAFKKARAFVHKLKLKSSAEWAHYCKGKIPGKPPKPDEIPTGVSSVYKEAGWIGFGDWLGTGTISPRDRVYRPFVEARAFAHKLELKSRAEWVKYCKGELPDKPLKPDDIPASPTRVYKDKGWTGTADWLGK